MCCVFCCVFRRFCIGLRVYSDVFVWFHCVFRAVCVHIRMYLKLFCAFGVYSEVLVCVLLCLSSEGFVWALVCIYVFECVVLVRIPIIQTVLCGLRCVFKVFRLCVSFMFKVFCGRCVVYSVCFA